MERKEGEIEKEKASSGQILLKNGYFSSIFLVNCKNANF